LLKKLYYSFNTLF